ncbi:MAG: helix-turn-helix transcriptional regulator [Parcubacteria group bacterium]
MSVSDDIIGHIYEASAFPEKWPHTLHAISTALGAMGGNLIRSTANQLTLQSSRDIAEITLEFDRAGWNEGDTRVSRLLARANHAGFLTDSDLHTESELANLPMYAEFLNPRGCAAGAATLIRGGRDDAMVVAIEGFRSHQHSRDSTRFLNRLRPHLCRAAVLSSEVEFARQSNLVDAFNAVGSAIGLLDRKGRLLGASDEFQVHLGKLVHDGPVRLRLNDAVADARFAKTIENLDSSAAGASIALRDEHKIGRAILNLAPAARDALQLFNSVAMFAVISRAQNNLLPDANIISALFDLTPAEARIARAIAEGLTPSEIALRYNVSRETVRSQLKRVLLKTSTKRQAELSLLVSSLA